MGIRVLPLQVNRQGLNNVITPTFLNVHFNNVSPQFPIEPYYLLVHPHRSLNLAPAVARAKILHPLQVLLVLNCKCFAHNICYCHFIFLVHYSCNKSSSRSISCMRTIPS